MFRHRGPERILTHERRLIRQAAAGLSRIPGVTVYGDGGAVQAGVLSFQIGREWTCEAVGEALGARGIAVRAGLHCAPLAHQSAGTLEAGTVRASVSAFNTPREVERFTHGGCAADRRAKIAASAAIFCVCTQGLFTEN